MSALATSAGFEAVDAGPLANSRYLEPIGEMNIHFGFFLGMPWWSRMDKFKPVPDRVTMK